MGNLPTVTRRSLGYNPALDGLRAFAVAGVIVQHVGFTEAGYFGVTVFFVISGYLITGLLLSERDSTGSIDLKAFYRRRFARLGPALLLATAVILVWLLATGEPIRTWWAGLLGTLTYTNDLLLSTPLSAHVGGYWEWSWSLGIEEQFYLVWPVLMILLLRGRLGRAGVATVAGAVIVLAWVDRAAMSHGHPTHDHLSFGFDPHMDAIAWGALISIVVAGRTYGARSRMVAQVLCVAGMVGLFLLIRRPGDSTKFTTLDLGGYGQAGVLCALIIGGVVIAPLGPMSWLLARPLLVHLGKLSYGLYLWNLLLANAFTHIFSHSPSRSGGWLVLFVAVLIGVAELSYRYVETPLRHRWAPPHAATPVALPEMDHVHRVPL